MVSYGFYIYFYTLYLYLYIYIYIYIYYIYLSIIHHETIKPIYPLGPEAPKAAANGCSLLSGLELKAGRRAVAEKAQFYGVFYRILVHIID